MQRSEPPARKVFSPMPDFRELVFPKDARGRRPGKEAEAAEPESQAEAVKRIREELQRRLAR